MTLDQYERECVGIVGTELDALHGRFNALDPVEEEGDEGEEDEEVNETFDDDDDLPPPLEPIGAHLPGKTVVQDSVELGTGGLADQASPVSPTTPSHDALGISDGLDRAPAYRVDTRDCAARDEARGRPHQRGDEKA